VANKRKKIAQAQHKRALMDGVRNRRIALGHRDISAADVAAKLWTLHQDYGLTPEQIASEWDAMNDVDGGDRISPADL
jgi:hypothetical protein